MLSKAAMVSVGGDPDGGVATANSEPQGLPSPETPPGELIHVDRMSASALIFWAGTVWSCGSPDPGIAEFEVLTISPAVKKALAMSCASSGPEPTDLNDCI